MPEQQEEKKGGVFAFFTEASPIGQTAFALGGLVVLFVLSLVIAVVLGIVLGDSNSVADTVAIVRDLFIILLAVQGMLIGIALIILILQIAAIVNLVENELKPVARDVKETANTVKGTVEFLSENAATPVIESQAWLAGFATLVSEATRLRKAFRRDKDSDESADKDDREEPATNATDASDSSASQE